MAKQVWSQAKSICSELIEDAIAEQLKSRQAADDDLEKGGRGTIATPQQMVGSRRGIEDILIEMSMKMPHQVKQKQNRLPNPIATESKRKRRRGPKTLSLCD